MWTNLEVAPPEGYFTTYCPLVGKSWVRDLVVIYQNGDRPTLGKFHFTFLTVACEFDLKVFKEGFNLKNEIMPRCGRAWR